MERDAERTVIDPPKSTDLGSAPGVAVVVAVAVVVVVVAVVAVVAGPDGSSSELLCETCALAGCSETS